MLSATCFATVAERGRSLPADRLVPEPIFTSTHAITIDAPPEAVSSRSPVDERDSLCVAVRPPIGWISLGLSQRPANDGSSSSGRMRRWRSCLGQSSSASLDAVTGSWRLDICEAFGVALSRPRNDVG